MRPWACASHAKRWCHTRPAACIALSVALRGLLSSAALWAPVFFLVPLTGGEESRCHPRPLTGTLCQRLHCCVKAAYAGTCHRVGDCTCRTSLRPCSAEATPCSDANITAQVHPWPYTGSTAAELSSETWGAVTVKCAAVAVAGPVHKSSA